MINGILSGAITHGIAIDGDNITYRAVDASGNTREVSAEVKVPYDRWR